MRLTLRTMLAYQDNVLSPNEAEELGRKIKESEFAAGLMERMRSVLKKLRMNAPKLDGKGMGNDANTVAEYLDSALPQDRVGDFERICLESDAHLAEVAGCHQILTLVLGKPADVPETLRERVYALGNVREAAVAAVPAGRSKPTAPATNGRAAAARPVLEVPEYLRAGRNSSFWRIAGGLAIGLLIAALLLRMMGPLDSSHPVLALVRGQAPVTDDKSVANAGQSASDGSGADSKTGVGVESVDAEAAKADSEIPPAPVADPPRPVEPEPRPVEPADAPLPLDNGEPSTPAPTTVVEAPSDPATPPAPDIDAVPPPPPAPAPAAVPDVPVAVDVGRFLSDEQVLAHMPADDGLWRRVPARAVLSSGERLVALPGFRPQIALASGVQVTLAGESAVQLLPPTEDGASRILVDNGRLVIVTAGAAGAQIALNLHGLEGVATLVDADSALAVSVKLYLPPGYDPLETPVIPVIELFNTRGRVAWDEAGQERVNIPPHHVRIYVGADPPETAGPFQAPEWIDSRNTGIERQSALVLERQLAEERPLNLSLAEALEHRQVDVRALAARCLAYLDNFEPVIAQLSDPRQSSFWTAAYDALRLAIRRGPGTAAKVLATLERTRPDQAGDLYRLLVGYSPDQLNKDGGLALVAYLTSDDMDVRVLTLQNLLAITGAMEFYMPQKKPDELRASIQAWKTRQAKGTITYRAPPTPLEAYKPLDKPPAGAADLPMLRGAVAPLVPPLP